MRQLDIQGVKCVDGYYSATDLIKQFAKKENRQIDAYNFLKRSAIRKSMRSYLNVTRQEPRKSVMGTGGHVLVPPIVLLNIYISMYKQIPKWGKDAIMNFIDDLDLSGDVKRSYTEKTVKDSISNMFNSPNKKLLRILKSIEVYDITVSKSFYYVSICLALISDKNKAVELAALCLL